MISPYLQQNIQKENARFREKRRETFGTPAYVAETYVSDLIDHAYFDALLSVRHFMQAASYHYFTEEHDARNVDLFMWTSSVSSPMCPGSDSEPIRISFGGLDTNLVDSSQFGFEPLLFHSGRMVYCYLPSMRGEDPDHRHLNQFYHCECELVGTLDDVMRVAEGYVKHLCEVLCAMEPVVRLASDDPDRTVSALARAAGADAFPRVSFDEAVERLKRESDGARFVRRTAHGRDITSSGELTLADLYGFRTPFWITHYDRDCVPFYQKPVAENQEKVHNADLIFPALRVGAFGGEVLGCGQRQDTAAEMRDSLRRQDDIPPEQYQWYINLRDKPGYRTTSGFGLGIERFLVWALSKPHIRDVSLYPRIKGVQTYP